MSVVSDAEAKEYYEDNSTLVPEVEEAPEADPELEEIGEEVADETEEELEADAEEAEDESESEDEVEEVEDYELTFGGTVKFPAGSMTPEIAKELQNFGDKMYADYTRKSQANAQTQKTLASKSESVEKLMDLNGEALQTYSVGLQLRNDIQQLQSVDLDTLWQSNPDQARIYSDSLAQKQAEFQNIVSLVDQQETALNEAKQSHSVRRGQEGRKALNEKSKTLKRKSRLKWSTTLWILMDGTKPRRKSGIKTPT